MSKKEVILGLKKPEEFTEEERKLIIEEWKSTGVTKQEIWFKYTGHPVENGRLLRWMRKLGYPISEQKQIFTRKMSKKVETELMRLKKQNHDLERALIQSELRASALNTMIEVAEKELKINIRKKSNTKQSKL